MKDRGWRRVFAALTLWLLATWSAALLARQPVALGASTRLPGAGSVEVAFAPWDDAEGLIVRVLHEARAQILVQAYLLSNRAITDALIDAAKRGLDVQVLVDSKRLTGPFHSRVPELVAAGIVVKQEIDFESAHNKVIVTDVDGEHPAVVTGSFNFTRTAQTRNAENVLVLRDQRDLAQRYAQNWRRHAAAALPYP